MKQVLIRGGGVVVEEVPAPSVRPRGRSSSASQLLVRQRRHRAARACRCRAAALPARARSSRTTRSGARGRDATQGFVAHVQARRGISSPPALPTGYSAAGVVVEVGERGDGFAPGDRVACAGAGIANHAELIDGAGQPRRARAGGSSSLDDASTVTLGAIALQGVRRAEPTLGETVGVIGLGILGQLTVQLLRAHGCRVDRLRSRPGARRAALVERRATGSGERRLRRTRARAHRRLRRRRGDRHRGDVVAASRHRTRSGVPPARGGSSSSATSGST